MATLADRKVKQAEAQERTLAFLAQGMSGAAAMEMVGRTAHTYSTWRATNPDFRKRCDAILGRRNGSFRNDAAEEGLDTHTLRGFRKHYFGYETYPHQQEMINAIENAAPGSRTMILLPPEWMKTTTLEDYMCKRLGEEPNLRICDLSESLDHAHKCLGRVQRRMTDRTIAPDYIDDFGPFRAPDREMAKPWNKDAITLLRSNHDEGDPSLICRGATSITYGSRWDLVILDDIQSRASIGKTASLLGLFRQDWQTRIGKTGKLILIGTRVGKGDVYEELLKAGLIDTLVRIPALDLKKPLGQQSNFPAVFDAQGNRVKAANGDPLGWSDDELAKRRFEVGEDIWERVYMQSGKSSGAGPFREEMVDKAFDNDRGIGGPKVGHKGIGRISGIDPALGGYCGIVSCSYDANFLYIEGIRNEPNLQRTEEIFAIMEQETIEHLPECWMFERNNLQHGFARDDRLMELRDKYGFYVQEHYTDATKADDKIGIPSMASAMSRGEIRLPGTPEARILIQPLVDQMFEWRVDVPAKLLRQDVLMALWFVYLKWQTVRQSIEQDLSAFDRSGSPSFTSYRTTLGTFR